MNDAIKITEIDAAVRQMTGENAECRPFLCDGSPIDSEVFLVGINPGTSTPFWPYWRLPHGCYKEDWITEYLKRHSRFKPTRCRIEILLKAIFPIKCLEANVFVQYSPSEKSLPAEARDTQVFEYLLNVLNPTVVFIHGKSAIKHMEKLLGVHLPHGQFTTVKYNGRILDFITGRHLSRGWSYRSVIDLGQRIQDRCFSRRNGLLI